jgi:hypothetical protein
MRRAIVAVLVAACGDDASTAHDASIGDDAMVVDGGVPDPCAATVACPSAGAVARGSGLHAIDRCAFPLVPASVEDVIDAYPPSLARVTIADVLGDLNRAGSRIQTLPGTTPGVQRAYAWEAGDEAVAYWIPQGITGSFDANTSGLVGGAKVVLASWYYDRASEMGSVVEKGVRIAIANATDPQSFPYRFALLVEPVAAVGFPTWRSVEIHAGGLAWVGDHLYVPVTTGGFRVFDLSRILQVDGLEDRMGRDTTTGTYHAHGYKYVIPQIASYTTNGACDPRFSFVALDRTSTPPSLVSGEYDAASVNGRVYRWPLDGAALQRTDQGRVVPDAAYVMAESHVQGAFAHAETFWLSSSRPANAAGELVRTRVGEASTTLGWSDTPEDLAFDPQGNSVWSLSEGTNARYVFEVSLDAID